MTFFFAILTPHTRGPWKLNTHIAEQIHACPLFINGLFIQIPDQQLPIQRSAYLASHRIASACMFPCARLYRRVAHSHRGVRTRMGRKAVKNEMKEWFGLIWSGLADPVNAGGPPPPGEWRYYK